MVKRVYSLCMLCLAGDSNSAYTSDMFVRERSVRRVNRGVLVAVMVFIIVSPVTACVGSSENEHGIARGI